MNINQGVQKSKVQTAADTCVAVCQKLGTQIDRVKGKLVAELQVTFEVPEKLFQLALNEAQAVAGQTEYPDLLFPVLATEKVQAAAKWNARQGFLRPRNSAPQVFH